MMIDFQYQLENTAETPREDIEKAVTDLWKGRNFMVIPKAPAICFSGWSIEGVHAENGHFSLVVSGRPSHHDRLIIFEIMNRVVNDAS